jgi:hypothetical protein
VITCGGLQADQLAVACGGSKNPTIVPFRGDYLKLKDPNNEKLKINGNIYPVPDPKFPFLGIRKFFLLFFFIDSISMQVFTLLQEWMDLFGLVQMLSFP